MKVEASIISSDDCTADIKPTSVIIVPDGESAEVNDLKDGIVFESMNVKMSVAGWDDGFFDIKPTVVVTAPDGKSAETNCDNEKPGPSGESTLKRKTEITFLEATKKIKLEPAD